MASKRILSIDVIRVIAMLFVIFLHTILNFTIRPDFFATPIWFLLEPVVVLSKTGVLLFFFLSGYLVIGKQRTVGDNLQKLWHRIVIPLLFFEVLRIVYNWYLSSSVDFIPFLGQEIQRLATFPSSPLWFLEMLVFFYLLNPLWQVLFLPKNRSLARYVTFLALCFSLGVTFLTYMFEPLPLLFNTFTAWTGFLFFYLYGALFQREWVTSRTARFYGILLIVCFGATLGGDYFASFARSIGDLRLLPQYTGNYLSIPVTGIAFALFHLLLPFDFSSRLRGELGQKMRQFIEWLAELSFGIYLIHIYVVGFLTDIFGFSFNTAGLNVYVFNALNVWIVLGTSIVLTWGIRKIPVLRTIIGEKA